MRKIILNLAMSLDGYIATEEGKYEWIGGHGDTSLNQNAPFDFDGFLKSIDTMVWGRRSYEDCETEPFEDKEIIVATSKNMDDYDNVKFINGDVVEYIKSIREKEGKDIYLFGGGVLIDEFIKHDLIDNYIISIIPTILGKGKPLFLENNPTIKLKLDNYVVEDGVVTMYYSKRVS